MTTCNSYAAAPIVQLLRPDYKSLPLVLCDVFAIVNFHLLESMEISMLMVKVQPYHKSSPPHV